MAGAYGLRRRGDAGQKAPPKVFAREDADGVRKKRDRPDDDGGADGAGEGLKKKKKKKSRHPRKRRKRSPRRRSASDASARRRRRERYGRRLPRIGRGWTRWRGRLRRRERLTRCFGSIRTAISPRTSCSARWCAATFCWRTRGCPRRTCTCCSAICGPRLSTATNGEPSRASSRRRRNERWTGWAGRRGIEGRRPPRVLRLTRRTRTRRTDPTTTTITRAPTD
mmetsp:Transcript_4355/g.19498  ORF Transcript_4355/g.19498 Transcript_4355/m.19498 type:complete len:224 (+) Transcript_4355:103-774(+)